MSNIAGMIKKTQVAQSYQLMLVGVLLLCLSLLAFTANANTSAQVTFTRVWAGPEYTRVTLESNLPIKYTLSLQSSPDQIILDLENTGLNPPLGSLSNKIGPKDPLIKKANIEYLPSNGVRLTLALKAKAVPRAFTLDPMGKFGYRLVLDVFPPDRAANTSEQHDDPLMALVKASEQKIVTKAKNTHKPEIALASFNPRPEKQKTIIVAIDAGHGGKDPGAIGPRGSQEKDITLSIAKKLKAKIDKEPGMHAVLTRTGDYFLPLAVRRTKARGANADLFISVHADAVPRNDARGSSVYTLSENGATSTTASWLAQKENESDRIGGIKLNTKDQYLRKTLIDLSINATINDSIKLAGTVLSAIGNVNHLHKRQVEQAGFAVLKSPDIPSILVETAFISNPSEEEKLRNEHYQDKMAAAIVSGIKRYFNNTRSRPVRTELAKAN